MVERLNHKGGNDMSKKNYKDNNQLKTFDFYENPLDGFCHLMIAQGMVENIKYSREFSVDAEITKKLAGGR
jgi:hypothetical protein